MGIENICHLKWSIPVFQESFDPQVHFFIKAKPIYTRQKKYHYLQWKAASTNSRKIKIAQQIKEFVRGVSVRKVAEELADYPISVSTEDF